jgi:predicted phage tail protein
MGYFIALAITLTAIPLLGCKPPNSMTPPSETEIFNSRTLPKEWLNKKVSIETAEQENVQYSIKNPNSPVPFLNKNQEWNNFKRQIHPDRDLWYWKSPGNKSNSVLVYFHGYCILQNKKIIEVFQLGKIVEYNE